MGKKRTTQSKHPAELDGFAGEIKCVFCNEPWTGKMLDVYAYTTEGCDTCGYGSETRGTVKIICEHCDRLVYQKDFHNR